ncbi:hypothetical protein VAB18032_14865 [Micromonospora maris AB-18-032]|nr:hypothetical protein VAB18032_14865 [Micromonospora maris AB-18-032]
MVLIRFRKAEDVALHGAGFGASRATAYRYRDEGFTVLAAQAQDLHTALRRVAADGWSHPPRRETVRLRPASPRPRSASRAT